MESTIEKLKNRFTCIEVRTKYDVITAHELLKEIGIKIFKNDEDMISFLREGGSFMYEYDSYKYLMIKPNEEWEISEEYTRSVTIDYIRDEIALYKNKKSLIEMDDDDKDRLFKYLNNMSNFFDRYLCYLRFNLNNISDKNLRSITAKLIKVVKDIEYEKCGVNLNSFEKSDFYNELFDQYLMEKRSWERSNDIDSLLD